MKRDNCQPLPEQEREQEPGHISLPMIYGETESVYQRGYYYDVETGFYYVSSRYYDPEIGGFVSADTIDVIDIQSDLYDKNLFAYCDNNPTVRADHGGFAWETIIDILSIASSIYDFYKKPSFLTAGYLAWDIGASVIPCVPGTYAKKSVNAGTKLLYSADEVIDAGKTLSKTEDIAKGSKRVFNVSKQKSKIFNGFKRVKGKSYRTSGKGKKKRYYAWDFTHNDIEVYDNKGNHLGSMNPETGEIYKKAVKGRTLW